MKEVRVDYRWWFVNWSIKRQIPERWEELNARQLIAIARLVKGEINETEYLKEFGDIPQRVIRRLDSYQLWSIGRLLTFTGAFEPWYKFILKFTGLAAPKPRLEGMTFGQFMFVDTYYGDWVGFDSAQPDEKADDKAELLNKFVGSLYIPEKEKFDSEKITLYKENASQLQEAEKIAITLNYRLLKEWLANLYPMLFPRPADLSEPKEKKVAAKPNTNGWLNVFEGIVGDDLIHQEEYFNLTVHVVMRHLSKKMKEYGKG